MVDGIQVKKATAVSQSKPSNVWIYKTDCTGYTKKWQAKVSDCVDLGYIDKLVYLDPQYYLY
jgi:hypothetical protein